MANTHYLILQLETIEWDAVDAGESRTVFRPLGDIHSYNPGRACEEYARTQLHEAMLAMEDGVTLVAVPAGSWTTVNIQASQELKLDVKVVGAEKSDEAPTA